MVRRIGIIVALATVVVMASAATASAATLRGKVVHRNRHAHSFVIAKRSGRLIAIHSRKSPALGRRVTVQGRFLSNGSFGARRVDVGRRSSSVRIRGVVTYSDAAGGRFVVSARGVSLAVSKSAAADAPPAVGTVVTVDGSFDDGDGDIDADTVEEDGQNGDYADLEGQILSIDLVARTLTITADDNDEITGATITVHIPDTWDMSTYAVGDEVEIVATLDSDGTYLAVEASLNGDGHEADDQGDDQGGDDQGDDGD